MQNSPEKIFKAVTMLVQAVRETVQECSAEGPVPESPVMLALQHHFPKVFPNADEFVKFIDFCVRSGVLKRGPNHTLEIPEGDAG